MSETLSVLKEQAESMDKKGALTALGVDERALERLVDVVDNHELGATPRAVLISVRGWLQRNSAQFHEAATPEVLAEWKGTVPASSSISRAIPLAAVIQEYLPSRGFRTIIDLGAGRAHASRVFLHPQTLQHEYISKWGRVSWDPENMPNISRVIAVDNREPSLDEARQVYLGRDGAENEKTAAIDEIEAQGDHDGRLVKILKDIRELTATDLSEHIGDDEEAPIIFLNNVLYAVSADVRAEVEEAVNGLARELGATIIQMEGWQVFEEEKPEITLPGRDKALAMPAFIAIGPQLDGDNMSMVAELDGNTGKPFILEKKNQGVVFVDKDGNEHDCGMQADGNGWKWTIGG